MYLLLNSFYLKRQIVVIKMQNLLWCNFLGFVWIKWVLILNPRSWMLSNLVVKCIKLATDPFELFTRVSIRIRMNLIWDLFDLLCIDFIILFELSIFIAIQLLIWNGNMMTYWGLKFGCLRRTNNISSLLQFLLKN